MANQQHQQDNGGKMDQQFGIFVKLFNKENFGQPAF